MSSVLSQINEREFCVYAKHDEMALTKEINK